MTRPATVWVWRDGGRTPSRAYPTRDAALRAAVREVVPAYHLAVLSEDRFVLAWRNLSAKGWTVEEEAR